MNYRIFKLGGLCFLLFLLSGFLLRSQPSFFQPAMDFISDSGSEFSDSEKQNERLEKDNEVFIHSTDISAELSANIPNIICYRGAIPAYPNGIWGHASEILGDTLYICGGVDQDGIATNLVYRYHIPYGQWSAGRSMPFIKAGGDMVKCGNALYYIGGGTTVSSGNFVTMRYRPVFGWDTVARIPRVVSGNTAECWGDSVIYSIAGGWSQYYGVIQVYRPASNTWTIIADSLGAGLGRRTHASGIVENQLFVASGFNGGPMNDLVIGTIGANANIINWEAGQRINCRGAMFRPGGVGIDGNFYVVGSETNPAPAQQDSIFRYNVNSGKWERPLSGRGAGASSNYWGVISAKIINNNVNIFIPGGLLSGAPEHGLYVARFRECDPDPVDTILVLVGDSTVGTATQINGRRAGRDTLFKYLAGLTSNYDIRYKDTSVQTIPSVLNSYKTIIIHEMASDATPVRYMSNGWRTAIKNWLTSGTIEDKRTLILIGGDMGYNYGRQGAGAPAYDSTLSKNLGKFIFNADNANMSGVNMVTWLAGDYSDSMTTSPVGGIFTPDGCSLLNGGTALSQYTGRTSMDSLAAIGHAPSGGNFVMATIFQDPRYFTGNGGTEGIPANENRGFKRILQLVLLWAKENGSIITGETGSTVSIADYKLFQNYPNPFNPETRINFSIPGSALVTLKVYDVLGKVVATLVNADLSTGSYSYEFNGSNLASGIYFYELDVKAQGSGTGNFRQVKKMALVK